MNVGWSQGTYGMLAWAGFVALVSASGCGGPAYDVVPGSGVVTVDGKPLPNAAVNFQPIGQSDETRPGPGSFGHTDSQGRFTLELVEPAQPGVVPGEHRVYITTAGSSADPTRDELTPQDANRLPPSAADGSIRVTVPDEGSYWLSIEITTRGARPRR